jgi:hypothetical protein
VPTQTLSPPATYDRAVDAIHYVVSGGGGGPLGPTSPHEDREGYEFLQGSVRAGYHFLRVAVDGRRLAVRVIQVVGSAGSYTTSTWETFAIE